MRKRRRISSWRLQNGKKINDNSMNPLCKSKQVNLHNYSTPINMNIDKDRDRDRDRDRVEECRM